MLSMAGRRMLSMAAGRGMLSRVAGFEDGWCGEEPGDGS